MVGLYISASGISNAIRRSEVRANNVANLRTSGFRASIPHSSETPGGGVSVDSISFNNERGPFEVTGRSLDVASTNGFFRVQQADGSFAFTRDGHFGLNANGEVVTSDGAALSPPIEVPAGASHVTVSRDGAVSAVLADGQTEVVGQLAVFEFTNPGGLVAAGGNLFLQTPASGEALPMVPTPILPGTIEGSNVNLAQEQIGIVLDSRTATANMRAFRAQDEMLGELLNILG